MNRPRRQKSDEHKEFSAGATRSGHPIENVLERKLMKQLNTLRLTGLLVLGMLLTLSIRQIDLGAQEAKAKKDTKPSTSGTVGNSGPEKTVRPQTYPTMFVDDVIENLSSAVQKLIEKKQAKTSAELKQELEKTSYAMTLVPESPTSLRPAELYQKCSESVFLVAGLTKPASDDEAWKTAFSTAFAVHEDGILSTSAHVFDHDDEDHGVVVMDKKGRIYPVVEVLASDRKADTCLFRIAAKGLKPLPLGTDQPPGTPVRAIGHPGDSFFYFSAGNIANYERDEEGAYWLNITADFGQGSSGGPVMDEAGNVIGQVSRTYTLYAGGEAGRRRHRRPHKTQNVDIVVGVIEPDAEHDDPKKKADPQMVFRACTPVSALKALIK